MGTPPTRQQEQRTSTDVQMIKNTYPDLDCPFQTCPWTAPLQIFHKQITASTSNHREESDLGCTANHQRQASATKQLSTINGTYYGAMGLMG